MSAGCWPCWRQRRYPSGPWSVTAWCWTKSSLKRRRGQYDLVVTGTHVTPGLNGSLVEDLSADILLAANRPVLVVRPE